MTRKLCLTLMLAVLVCAAAGAQQRTRGRPVADGGSQVGDVVPNLELLDLEGRPVRLSQTWAERPALIVTASVTCPISVRQCPSLTLQEHDFSGRVNPVILYTVEAHPNDGLSPYERFTGQRRPHEYEQPSTIQRRLEFARAFSEMLSGKVPVIVDNMDNEAWKALGSRPNMALLIDTQGRVLSKQDWFDPEATARLIDAEASATDASEEQQVDPRARRLQERLRRADADGDGRLTRQELVRPALFRRLDADRDGVITQDEVAALTERLPQQRIAPTHADLSYGPHERNVLDLYLAKSDEPTPLLVQIHGGGFVGGDKRSVRPDLVRAMHDHGISVASINYRFVTTDPMPACYHDAARAIQFLRHHADEYSLDAGRIAATGGSAGAGISLWLAFHDDLADPESEDPVLRESTRVACAQVNSAQVSYDPRFWREIGLTRGLQHRSFSLMYGAGEDEPADSPRLIRLYEECAPITHVSADDPPVYMVYGVTKDVGPETPMGAIIHHPLHGLALQEKLQPLGIECTVVYRGGPAPPLSATEFIVRRLTGPKAADKE